MPTLPGLARDPRHAQIAVQSLLIAWGIAALGWDLPPAQVAATFLGTLGAQWLATRSLGLAGFEWKSALISGLGLCLLLRAAAPGWALLAGALAIGSKFAIRVRGKHLFNPTAFALAALLAAGAPVWVSPGQWGNAAVAAFAMASLGSMVVHRSARSDVTWAFLGASAAIVFGRAAWLGQPLAVPAHQLSNGAFVLFAFHMLSDPKTTPDSRAGRVLFGVAVALAAWAVPFLLWRRNGLIWALVACAPLVPALDRLMPGARFSWNAPPARPEPEPEDHRHETPAPRPAPAAAAGGAAA